MAEVVDQIVPILRGLAKDADALLDTVRSSLPLDTDLLTTPQGPSLLTLKNAALLSYLHHLVLLCSTRLRARRIDADQGADLVRNSIELRLILEKVRPVEGRMRGLVERLVRAAEEEDKAIREGRMGGDRATTSNASSSTTDMVDPLAFRPNLAALSAGTTATGTSKGSTEGKAEDRSVRNRGDGIYRPPRLAPVVYNADSVNGTASNSRKGGAKERLAPRNAALLSDLSASMSANPYETSSGGVGIGGGTSATASSRAKALARMQQYEEDNFTRLTMSKRDAQRRRRDEADVALGGAGRGTKRGRIGAGLEEEFGDLLRNRDSQLRGDKRSSALQRARSSARTDDGGMDLFAGAGRGVRSNGGVFGKKVRREQQKGKGRR